jgi:hypothetical protein
MKSMAEHLGKYTGDRAGVVDKYLYQTLIKQWFLENYGKQGELAVLSCEEKSGDILVKLVSPFWLSEMQFHYAQISEYLVREASLEGKIKFYS